MGKYRNTERIAYKLGKNFEKLEGATDEFKKGYKEALELVQKEIEKDNEYYERREKRRSLICLKNKMK